MQKTLFKSHFKFITIHTREDITIIRPRFIPTLCKNGCVGRSLRTRLLVSTEEQCVAMVTLNQTLLCTFEMAVNLKMSWIINNTQQWFTNEFATVLHKQTSKWKSWLETNSLIDFKTRIMDVGVCMEFLYYLSVYLFRLTVVFHVKLSELNLRISNIIWFQPCRKL